MSFFLIFYVSVAIVATVIIEFLVHQRSKKYLDQRQQRKLKKAFDFHTQIKDKNA
jgi:hypothetical protein|tara:strand:- start:87 stop:251 length:165 start_codon:yes stop_codon:yes gene_type:complete